MRHRACGSLAVAASAVSLLLAPMVVHADQPSSSSHIVQPGETLSQIAADAGVEAAALAASNGVDDANLIVAGQTLKLPAAAAVLVTTATPQPQRGYTVADGDTLWSIAHQFGSTTEALSQLNKLDDAGHLSIGAVLALPGGAATSATAARPPAPSSPPTPTPARGGLLVSYTVQPGETLNQIARQFDVRADAIVQASGLDDGNKLGVGAVLKVPVPGKEHVVSAGETLRDIAAAEKVDLGSLIDFNSQLDDPELIRVGQVVQVPVPANQQAAAAPPAPAQPAAAPAPAQAQPKPTPSPSAAPATATPQAPAQPTPKPTAAVAAVAPPKGAPSDGLAGAGLKLLGAPYVFGGSSPSGFDCSGFVWYVARQIGKPLSRGMLGEYNSGSHPAREELKPGDLVFFQNTYSAGLSHNGIYIGNGQFVHAADETDGVTISNLGTAYWSSHWFGATRLP